MKRLTDQTVLALWDGVEIAEPALRPAVLLDRIGAAVGEPAPDPAETLSVGHRDRALIAWRRRLFGSEMTCQVTCPECGEAIAFALDLAAFGAGPDAPETAAAEIAGRLYRFRPVTTRDLAGALAYPSTNRMEALVRACALDPLPDPFSAAIIEAASDALRLADPDAEIAVDMVCPDCGTAADFTFDIGACLAEDIRRAARRLLREVHHLASAYGWSEAESLAVPRRRRREYILMRSG